MFDFQRKKCTGEVQGTVTKMFYGTESGSPRVTVEYLVDGNKYVIKENISRSMEKITIGRIPIGVRKTAKVHTNVGESILVLYNPDKPKMAYIKGNDGKYV